MTPSEYRAALAALGLTQAGAAELIGVNPRTSRRWALGESPIPQAVARLMAMMQADTESRSRFAPISEGRLGRTRR